MLNNYPNMAVKLAYVSSYPDNANKENISA